MVPHESINQTQHSHYGSMAVPNCCKGHNVIDISLAPYFFEMAIRTRQASYQAAAAMDISAVKCMGS